MSSTFDLYPPAPQGIPANLTASTRRYCVQVVLVLLSLLLFVLLYLALVAAAGYFVWWSFTYSMGEPGRGNVVLKIGAIAVSVMLFLFLLKGLFKRQKMDTSFYVRVREEEQPELFQFIRALCRETRAPFPKRIYVSPEVNAAVFYDSSLLSLILPVRKNLLIGLGLVNVLTLDEFKAVLAHEFGHFSQSSMKLGSYVYTANGIITDMVYGRDSWDRLLTQWQQQDIRVAVFGWALGGVVWGLRQVLAGIFRVINLGNLALSRQMEFNADLVAVSVSGSDALIHALAKLDFAGQALGQAVQDLQAASDHQLYSRDVFHHQSRAAGYLRSFRKDPRLGVVPDLPDDPASRNQIFQPGDSGIPSMWASHPTNFEREENAKRHYVRSLLDGRSPWLLFRDAAGVREAVTRRVYRSWMPPDKELGLSSAEQVQAFIDDEHAETTYDPKYHGLYEGRYLEPGDVGELARASSSYPEDQLARRHADLYGGELEAWMKEYRERLAEFDRLCALRGGKVLTGKDLMFRGQPIQPRDLERLWQMVDQELGEDRQKCAKLDRQVFLVHYAMARLLGGGRDLELLSRYRFHLGAQDFLRKLSIERANAEAVVQYLVSRSQLSEQEMRDAIAGLNAAHAVLDNGLREADSLMLPRLKNMETGQPLGDFLLEDRLVSPLDPSANSIAGDWIGAFFRQVALVLDRLRRIYFKSMGGILALQEQIAKAWQERARQEALA